MSFFSPSCCQGSPSATSVRVVYMKLRSDVQEQFLWGFRVMYSSPSRKRGVKLISGLIVLRKKKKAYQFQEASLFFSVWGKTFRSWNFNISWFSNCLGIMHLIFSSFSLSFINIFITPSLPITITFLYMCSLLPWWLRGKESTCNAGDLSSIPGLGRSHGGGNGNPLQYSRLENPTEEPGGL